MTRDVEPASHPVERSDQAVARRKVPGIRRLLTILLVVLVVVGLAAVAYFTPVLSARDVSVTGATQVPAEELEKVVAPLRGRPLLQIRPAQRARYAADVAAVSPWIDSATVTVKYPSTLVVAVVERESVAYVKRSDGFALVDAKGVPFTRVPEAPILTPRLTVDDPQSGDPKTQAAIGVLTSLPADIRGQVVEVGADSPANVRLVLRDRRSVNWGDAGQAEQKAAALRAVMSQPGRELTVIDPSVPTVR